MHDGDIGFVVRSGEVLIAIGERDGQKAAETAAAEAKTAPLDRLASFQDAKHWLGNEQLVLVWMDMQKYDEMLTALMGGPLTLTPASSGQGTSIIGLRVTDDGIEGRYRSFGAQKKSAGLRDAVARLSELPANTELGAVLAMPDEPLSTRGSSPFPYSSITGLLFGITGVLSGESILEPSVGEPPDYSEAEMKQIEELLRKDPADLTEEEAKRLEDLIGFIPSEPLSAEPSPPPWSDAEMKEIDELMHKDPADLTESESMRLKELLGYDPEDLQDPGTIADFDTEDPFAALAGATVSVAVTRLAAGASVHLLADMASADAAKTLADLAEDSADDVTVTVDNTTVTVVSRDYAPLGSPFKRSTNCPVPWIACAPTAPG